MVANLDFLLRFFLSTIYADRNSFSIVLFLSSLFLSIAYVYFGFYVFLISRLGFYKILPKRCTVRFLIKTVYVAVF